jgi:PTS system nitrogen regulatory IIA component
MALTDILTAEAILPSLKSSSKKQLLADLAQRAHLVTGIAERDIFDALLQRERLGSTGIGNGIAIPHGKFPELKRLVGVFARLERPIDYEALDGQTVDLVFLLLAPEAAGADHLKGLARIARALRNTGLAAKLRATRDAAALHALLTVQETPQAA